MVTPSTCPLRDEDAEARAVLTDCICPLSELEADAIAALLAVI